MKPGEAMQGPREKARHRWGKGPRWRIDGYAICQDCGAHESSLGIKTPCPAHPGIDPALLPELVAAVRECDAKLTEMLEWFDGSEVPAEAMWVQNRLHSLAARMEADDAD